MRLWPIVGSGLLAGLVAGLILGFLLLAFAMPLILAAEKYESYPGKQAAGPSSERKVGTVLGAAIIGSVYGLILAVIYALTARTPMVRPIVRGLRFGLLGYVVVSFIPSLVFLPNPPGVEARASVPVRQSWWLAIILLEIVGIFTYRLISKHFRSRSPFLGRLLGLASFGALTLVPFLLGPPNALSKTLVPRELLLSFRLVSLATLFMFWLILGLLVGWLYSRLKAEMAA